MFALIFVCELVFWRCYIALGASTNELQHQRVDIFESMGLLQCIFFTLLLLLPLWCICQFLLTNVPPVWKLCWLQPLTDNILKWSLSKFRSHNGRRSIFSIQSFQVIWVAIQSSWSCKSVPIVWVCITHHSKNFCMLFSNFCSYSW